MGYVPSDELTRKTIASVSGSNGMPGLMLSPPAENVASAKPALLPKSGALKTASSRPSRPTGDLSNHHRVRAAV